MLCFRFDMHYDIYISHDEFVWDCTQKLNHGQGHGKSFNRETLCHLTLKLRRMRLGFLSYNAFPPRMKFNFILYKTVRVWSVAFTPTDKHLQQLMSKAIEPGRKCYKAKNSTHTTNIATCTDELSATLFMFPETTY